MDAEVGEPLEYPGVWGLAASSFFTTAGVPVGDGGAELREDELVEDCGVDEWGEEGAPDVEEGEDWGGLVDVPVVIDGGADLWEPEGEEHAFVVGCVFAP